MLYSRSWPFYNMVFYKSAYYTLFILENCEDIPISNFISYNQTDIDNEMINAARAQNFHLLRCLIQRGANINAEKDGITALIYAAAYGSLDIVKVV